MSGPINDPANYREMCRPFASAKEANDALTAFSLDVHAARQKHRIADVLTVTSVNIQYPDGEGAAMASGFCGNSLMAESMAAWAFGKEQADRNQTIQKILKNAPK